MSRITTEELITAREFKIWLEGVEEMQDDEWIPSSVQWKKIREKISNIEDTVVPQAPTQQYAQPTSFAPAFDLPSAFGGAAPPSHSVFQGGSPPSVDASNGYSSVFAS